jgi:hypothetical protein
MDRLDDMRLQPHSAIATASVLSSPEETRESP